MTPVVDVAHLTKSYRATRALDDVSLQLEANTIYGLLGRNGAGKTTLMSILTAQNFRTSGEVTVFGADPYENPSVLQRLCFVRESQKYPDSWNAKDAFAAAALAFPRWDEALCRQLIAEFDVPLRREVKKLSRGQQSAVGVVIGLASRAELTFFDEPYLGLDAVARQLFYDRLLEDYAAHPRTIVLSSHLIDEVANLVEHVVLLDRGRIIIDEPSEALRDRASVATGDREAVDAFIADREVLHRENLGRVSSATVLGSLTDHDRAQAVTLGVELSPVPLQQLIVRLTQDATHQKEVAA